MAVGEFEYHLHTSEYLFLLLSARRNFLRLSDRHEHFDLSQNFWKFLSDNKYACSLHLYSHLPLVKGEILDCTCHYKTNLLLSPSFECCMPYPDNLVWQIQLYILQNFHHICFCWLGAFFLFFYLHLKHRMRFNQSTQFWKRSQTDLPFFQNEYGHLFRTAFLKLICAEKWN